MHLVPACAKPSPGGHAEFAPDRLMANAIFLR